MRKLALEEIGCEEAPNQSRHTGLGARKGKRGEVNLPPGVRRFGKSFGRKGDRTKGERIYTLDQRVGGFYLEY